MFVKSAEARVAITKLTPAGQVSSPSSRGGAGRVGGKKAPFYHYPFQNSTNIFLHLGHYFRRYPFRLRSPVNFYFRLFLLLASVLTSQSFGWSSVVNTTGSLSGVARLHVEARGLTGSSSYPVLVIAGSARPSVAPFLTAKPGRWSCNAGTNSWVCQRDLPVGQTPNDTLDLEWSISSGLAKVDSLRSIAGGWIVYMGATGVIPPVQAREYSVLGTNSVRLSDRVQVHAGAVGAGVSVELGVNDTIGDLLTAGNVTLRDYSVVTGHLTYAGTSTIAPTAKVLSGIDHLTPILPSVSPVTCVPGSTDKTVNTGTLVLAPGAYNNLTVNAGAEVVLTGGVYQFNSITFQAGAIATMNPSGQVICEIRRKRPVNSGQSGRVPWWSESLQGTR